MKIVDARADIVGAVDPRDTAVGGVVCWLDLETSSSRDRDPWRSEGQTPLVDIVLRDGLVHTPSSPPLFR